MPVPAPTQPSSTGPAAAASRAARRPRRPAGTTSTADSQESSHSVTTGMTSSPADRVPTGDPADRRVVGLADRSDEVSTIGLIEDAPLADRVDPDQLAVAVEDVGCRVDGLAQGVLVREDRRHARCAPHRARRRRRGRPCGGPTRTPGDVGDRIQRPGAPCRSDAEVACSRTVHAATDRARGRHAPATHRLPTCHGHPRPRGLLPSRADRAAGAARLHRRRPREGLPRAPGSRRARRRRDPVDLQPRRGLRRGRQLPRRVPGAEAAARRDARRRRRGARRPAVRPLGARRRRPPVRRRGGLDSMVLGETQIHAQVREALRRAEAEGAAGPTLTGLFHAASRAGRRVRQETSLGAAPDAFVALGADLADEALGGSLGRDGVVVGAGQMAALAVKHLRRRGVGAVRDPEPLARARARAGRADGRRTRRPRRLPDALANADLVVTRDRRRRHVIRRRGRGRDGRPRRSAPGAPRPRRAARRRSRGELRRRRPGLRHRRAARARSPSTTPRPPRDIARAHERSSPRRSTAGCCGGAATSSHP